ATASSPSITAPLMAESNKAAWAESPASRASRSICTVRPLRRLSRQRRPLDLEPACQRTPARGAGVLFSVCWLQLMIDLDACFAYHLAPPFNFFMHERLKLFRRAGGDFKLHLRKLCFYFRYLQDTRELGVIALHDL